MIFGGLNIIDIMHRLRYKAKMIIVIFTNQIEDLILLDLNIDIFTTNYPFRNY